MKKTDISITCIYKIDSSVKKMRSIFNEIKKMDPVKAISVLMIDNRKTSKQLARAIKSALNNASLELKKDKDMLQFHVIRADQGRFLKRYRPGSRGMAKPIKKHTCHVTIELKVRNSKNNSNKEK